MAIESIRQLENARAKLRMVEDRLDELDAEPVTNPRTRDLTRQALRKLLNQLREEIARFESNRPGRSDGP